MSVRSFLDTNVIVYGDDNTHPKKQARALDLLEELWRARTGVVSSQVLQEYFVTVTRKLGLEAGIARRKLEILAGYDVAIPDVTDILAAIDLHRLHKLSFWDALIVRAAKQTGCRVLFSENFQTHREFEGLRIVNPFAA